MVRRTDRHRGVTSKSGVTNKTLMKMMQTRLRSKGPKKNNVVNITKSEKNNEFQLFFGKCCSVGGMSPSHGTEFLLRAPAFQAFLSSCRQVRHDSWRQHLAEPLPLKGNFLHALPVNGEMAVFVVLCLLPFHWFSKWSSWQENCSFSAFAQMRRPSWESALFTNCEKTDDDQGCSTTEGFQQCSADRHGDK